MGGLVSTVSTDHFEEVCLGTKHISIQGSRFNGIYNSFSRGRCEIENPKRYLHIYKRFCEGYPDFFSSDGTVSTVSTDHFKQVSLGTKHISIQGLVSTVSTSDFR